MKNNPGLSFEMLILGKGIQIEIADADALMLIYVGSFTLILGYELYLID